MSDLVTPLLKTLQHLLTSLREKANHSHPCTLPGLFPFRGPCMCCSFCPECSFPGSNMTCSFTLFRSPVKIWSSVKTFLATQLKVPTPPQTSYSPPLLYFPPWHLTLSISFIISSLSFLRNMYIFIPEHC